MADNADEGGCSRTYDDEPENDAREGARARPAHEGTATAAHVEIPSTAEIKTIDASKIRYETVWKKDDFKYVTEGVVRLWDDQTGGQMSHFTKQQRLKNVCVVAYDRNEVIAVSTISLEDHQGLWCKVGFFQCLVHKDYQRKGVAKQLALLCKNVLADYSKEHPDEQIQAMGMKLSASLLGERSKRPFWPELGMSVIGYNEYNMQIRIAWFDHIRLEY